VHIIRGWYNENARKKPAKDESVHKKRLGTGRIPEYIDTR
jgi:hypothetical protein